ncbi:MAG: hypothetical protein GXO83_11255 [Chlorobi bacterium]|nr:hypothetical protein [Chlorobiota bacterium]
MKTELRIVMYIFLVAGLTACQKPAAEKKAVVFHSVTGDTLSLALPITYDVIIRNPNPDDSWTTECLAGMDQEAMTNFIFSALYEKKLTAYDFYTGKSLSLRKIRKIEEAMGNDRSRLAKIQFTENWYLDTARMTLDKKVTSMMFGYEVYNDNGNVRGYKAAFRVNLNEK